MKGLIARLLAMTRRVDPALPRCVACDSFALTWLAEGVYRCKACDYEGGPGWAARARARREAAFARMDPPERRRSARRDLREAQRLLRAAFGDLNAAKSELRRDLLWMLIRDREMQETTALDRIMSDGVGRMLEAKQRLDDATIKLGRRLDAPHATLDARAERTELESPGGVLARRKTIDRAVRQCRALLVTTTAILRAEFPRKGRRGTTTTP